jgi:hypothetical protein
LPTSEGKAHQALLPAATADPANLPEKATATFGH